MLSNTLMIVALGAFIAITTAVTLNQDRMRRILGIASWSVSVLLLGAMAAFALDAVQSRAEIRSDLLFSYQIASLTAVAKILLGALSFALFGRGCRADHPIRQEAGGPVPVRIGK